VSEIVCRHFVSAEGNFTLCALKGEMVGGCHSCGSCPKCMGLTYKEVTRYDIKIGRRRMLEVKKCMNCGYQTNGVEIVLPELKQDTPNLDDKGRLLCSVEGCSNGLWDKAFYMDRPICIFHRDQLRTWKYKKMPDEKIPLVLSDAKLLIENPLYNEYKARAIRAKERGEK